MALDPYTRVNGVAYVGALLVVRYAHKASNNYLWHYHLLSSNVFFENFHKSHVEGFYQSIYPYIIDRRVSLIYIMFSNKIIDLYTLKGITIIRNDSSG